MKNKIILILSLLMLSSCIQYTVKKEDFFNLKENEKITGFKTTIDLEDDKFNASYTDRKQLYSFCSLILTEKENEIASLFNYLTDNDYVFFKTSSNDSKIYLTAVNCVQERFLYTKNRIKKIYLTIADVKDGKKVNYGGDIEIDWTPDTFKFSDLFRLGNLGVQDKGTLGINVKDEFKDYQNYLSKYYGVNKNDIGNITDKSLLKNPKLFRE